MKPTNHARKLSHSIALLLAGFSLSGTALAGNIAYMSAGVSATPITTHLYSLDGTGSTSISFDAALQSPLNSWQGTHSSRDGWDTSNYTWNANGTYSYLRRSETTASNMNGSNTSFTLSAHTLAVFESTVLSGVSYQNSCGGPQSYYCGLSANGYESGGAYASARMETSGVGYYGTLWQSASSNTGETLLVENMNDPSCPSCTSASSSASYTASLTDYYNDGVNPPQPYLIGAYYSDTGLLSVAFLNLTDAAMNGTVSVNVEGYTRLYGKNALVSSVPLPTSILLLGTGLLGLVGVARRKAA